MSSELGSIEDRLRRAGEHYQRSEHRKKEASEATSEALEQAKRAAINCLRGVILPALDKMAQSVRAAHMPASVTTTGHGAIRFAIEDSDLVFALSEAGRLIRTGRICGRSWQPLYAMYTPAEVTAQQVEEAVATLAELHAREKSHST